MSQRILMAKNSKNLNNNEKNSYNINTTYFDKFF